MRSYEGRAVVRASAVSFGVTALFSGTAALPALEIVLTLSSGCCWGPPVG